MDLKDKIINDQHLDKIQEMYEEEVRAYKERVKQEEDRVAAMTCPCCKSAEKIHNVESTSNGVMGPGYSSHVTADYYICRSCGVHYNDMNKIELICPDKPFFL